MNVFLDLHAASNAQQHAVACCIASSHEDLPAVASTSSFAGLHSQSIVPSTVSQRIPINKSSLSSKNSSNGFRLLGFEMFNPPILNMDRTITTFGSILASIKKSFTDFPSTNLPSSRCSEPFLHPSPCYGYFSKFSNMSFHQNLPINFPNCPLEGVETCPFLNQLI